MASAPPQPSSQRSSPPRSGEAPHQPAPLRSDSETFSTRSEDSETLLLLNGKSANEQSDSTAPNTRHARTSSPSQSKQEEEEPRKCWICFTDETEDTPMSSEWRSPCACALTAHEGCLLDWIADMEAPKGRRAAGSARKKILCPQCKTEIKLERPRNLVVDGVRALEKATGLMILPSILGVLGVTVYEACYVHGVSTVYLVFGMKDAAQILEPLQLQTLPFGSNSVFVNGAARLVHNWRLHTGLFMIPSVLIFSRTHLADSILPILPMVYFASASGAEEIFEVGTWPPSAALSFGLLPYVRSAYNFYYDKVWKPHMNRWLLEIQPRHGEEQGGDAAGADAGADDVVVREDDEDNLLAFDINLVVQGMDDEDEHDHDHDHDHHDHDHEEEDSDEDEEDEDDAAPAPNVPLAPAFDEPPLDVRPDAAAAAPVAPPPAAPAAQNIAISTSKLADTILGALIFPSIAAAVGELLRLSLPKSWVSLPGGAGRATGILQARWGRTLVGGCAFVVIRDAVMVYVRWKMAVGHRGRRVLDYAGGKKNTKTSSQA